MTGLFLSFYIDFDFHYIVGFGRAMYQNWLRPKPIDCRSCDGGDTHLAFIIMSCMRIRFFFSEKRNKPISPHIWTHKPRRLHIHVLARVMDIIALPVDNDNDYRGQPVAEMAKNENKSMFFNKCKLYSTFYYWFSSKI